MRCVPVSLWWWFLCVPWPVCITSGSCSALPSSIQHLTVHQYPPPLSSPYIYCPPSVLPETAFSPSWVRVGFLCVFISVPFLIRQFPSGFWEPWRRYSELTHKLIDRLFQVAEVWVSVLHWSPLWCHDGPDWLRPAIPAIQPDPSPLDLSQYHYVERCKCGNLSTWRPLIFSGFTFMGWYLLSPLYFKVLYFFLLPNNHPLYESGKGYSNNHMVTPPPY